MSVKGVDLGTSAAKHFVRERLRGMLSDGAEDDQLVADLVTSATGGRLHGYPLPDTLELPATVYAKYGATDDLRPLGRDMPVVAATIRLQIKTICAGFDDTVIEEPAGIVNQLLDGKQATVEVLKSNGDLYGTFYVECNRESELLMDAEPTENEAYQELGGIYAFHVTRVA